MDCFQHGQQKTKEIKKFTSHKSSKLTLATRRGGPSSTIFASMYMDIIGFARLTH
jgi:hypothetical protein